MHIFKAVFAKMLHVALNLYHLQSLIGKWSTMIKYVRNTNAEHSVGHCKHSAQVYSRIWFGHIWLATNL